MAQTRHDQQNNLTDLVGKVLPEWSLSNEIALTALKILLHGLIDRLQCNLVAQGFQTFDQVAGEALGLELV